MSINLNHTRIQPFWNHLTFLVSRRRPTSALVLLNLFHNHIRERFVFAELGRHERFQRRRFLGADFHLLVLSVGFVDVPLIIVVLVESPTASTRRVLVAHRLVLAVVVAASVRVIDQSRTLRVERSSELDAMFAALPSSILSPLIVRALFLARRRRLDFLSQLLRLSQNLRRQRVREVILLVRRPRARLRLLALRPRFRQRVVRDLLPQRLAFRSFRRHGARGPRWRRRRRVDAPRRRRRPSRARRSRARRRRRSRSSRARSTRSTSRSTRVDARSSGRRPTTTRAGGRSRARLNPSRIVES